MVEKRLVTRNVLSYISFHSSVRHDIVEEMILILKFILIGENFFIAI